MHRSLNTKTGLSPNINAPNALVAEWAQISTDTLRNEQPSQKSGSCYRIKGCHLHINALEWDVQLIWGQCLNVHTVLWPVLWCLMV